MGRIQYDSTMGTRDPDPLPVASEPSTSTATPPAAAVPARKATSTPVEEQRQEGVTQSLSESPKKAGTDESSSDNHAASLSATATAARAQTSESSQKPPPIHTESNKAGKVAAQRTADSPRPRADPHPVPQEFRRLGDLQDIPVAPLPLRTRSRCSTPGAYALAGRNASGDSALQRTSMLNYSLVGRRSGSASTAPPLASSATQPISQAARSGLAQATPVTDTLNQDQSVLIEAEEVDPTFLEQRASREQKERLCKQIGLGLILLSVVIAASLGLRLGLLETNDDANTSVVSSDNPGLEDLSTSEMPSAAPTGALALLLAGLPDYTLASLNDIDTPQWKAMDWLSRHHDLTHLPEWRKTQLFALATFFHAAEGEMWHHAMKERWMNDKVDECLWFSSGFGSLVDGVYHVHEPDSAWKVNPCNDQGEFTSLYLDWFDLSGLSPWLPPEISLLTSLTRLSLFMCSVKGSLSSMMPSELFEMTQLTWLSLNVKPDLADTIPTELGLLTRLEAVFLAQDSLSGFMPSELGLLTSLKRMDLYENDLIGRVPTQLGMLTRLERLDLFDTNLTGPLPSELGLLTSLEIFQLFTNRFSSHIPSEFGSMTNLERLDARNNFLSGSLPSELSSLTRLESLQLGYNQLSDFISGEWLPTFMKVLAMDHNAISGILPTQLWSLSSLVWLSLSMNSLTGPLPTKTNLLSSSTSLTTLWLADNLLTGEVPSTMGLMASLKDLQLQENGLTGTLSGELSGIKELRLHGNQFRGKIPESLCSLLGCDCSGNSSLASTSSCAELAPIPAWPGQFPQTQDAVVLNIHTDTSPEETKWIWQQWVTETSDWGTIQGSGTVLERKMFLHSVALPLTSGTSYKLILSDSSGNGLLYGGWATLAGANQTILLSVSRTRAFSRIMVVLDVATDGLINITTMEETTCTELLVVLGNATVCPCGEQ